MSERQDSASIDKMHAAQLVPEAYAAISQIQILGRAAVRLQESIGQGAQPLLTVMEELVHTAVEVAHQLNIEIEPVRSAE